MKSLLIAIAVMATLPFSAVAQNSRTPDTYVISLGLEYEIRGSLHTTTANRLGVPLRDNIEVALYFARPDCLAYYNGNEVTYISTSMEMTAFGKQVSTSVSSGSWMILTDEQTGSDQFQLTLFAEGMRLGGQNSPTLILRTFNLPPDALDSTEFPTDSGLVTDILEFPQLQASLQLPSSAGSPVLFMEVTSISADIEHLAAFSDANQQAQCTPPKP